MKVRLQKLDEEAGRRAKFTLCTQRLLGDSWTCRTVTGWRLASELMRAGVDDPREVYEIEQQVRAARRNARGKGGYVEYDPETGIRREEGMADP